MARVQDISGQRFGRLVVVKQVASKTTKETRWLCLCDCGTEKEVGRSNIGRTVLSCGCFGRERARETRIALAKGPQPCIVDGCINDNSKGGGGMCGMHYMRHKRYGDVNYLTPDEKWSLSQREAQLANVQSVKPTTYRKYLGRHMHRVVAEEKYGRKIRRGEHVHHIDGNKHNNHPDNLEILTAEEHARHHMEETWRAKRELQSQTVPEASG